MLLKKTPLWYYVLREAAVLDGGDRLGPVGGRIVAETFVRMLKRDGNSLPECEWRIHANPAVERIRDVYVRRLAYPCRRHAALKRYQAWELRPGKSEV